MTKSSEGEWEREGEGEPGGEAALAELRSQNEALRARLEAAERGTSQFASMLAHELRTPLGAILMWTHVLRLGQDSDRESALNAIEASAKTQSQMIGRLLDLTRALTGSLQIDRRPLDLYEVVCAAVDELRPTATAMDARLRLKPESGPFPVRGDAVRLREVVTCLVRDAIHASPAGGLVEVSVGEVAGAAQVVVHDSSDGVGPEDLAHMFTAFWMGGDPGGRRPSRPGVGLPLARLVAELHDGTITAETCGAQGGCALILRIPIER